MKLKLLSITLFLQFISNAQVGTSFESVTGITFSAMPECRYFDNDNTTVHELQNYTTTGGCGLIYVNTPSTQNELGFKIILNPLGNNGNLGFTDGDAFGVATNESLIGELGNGNSNAAAPNGTQGFLMEAIDGEVDMVFDEVSLSGANNTQVSLQYFISSTTWEIPDYLYARIEITGCGTNTTIPLIDTRNQDIDNLSIEGSWNIVNADLSAYSNCTAQLIIGHSSNSAAEELGIDNIIFTDGQVLNTNEQNLIQSQVKVYETRTKGNYKISVPENIVLREYNIYNMLGEILKTGNFTKHENIIDMSTFTSGIYIIKLKSNSNQIIKKVIKN